MPWLFLGLWAAAAVLTQSSCGGSAAPAPAESVRAVTLSPTGTRSTPTDGETQAGGETQVELRASPAQLELLTLAMQVATAMPLEPHIKTRSKVQSEVVVACLELGEEQLALDFSAQIENWRRGECYAVVAKHRVLRGELEGVEQLLELAAQQSALATQDLHPFESGQAWKRDFIRADIAQARYLMGQTEEAQLLGPEAEPSEQDKLEIARCLVLNKLQFADEVQVLDAILASQQFDRMRNAMAAYLVLYERFYSEPDLRQLVEAKLEQTINSMPADIRFQTLIDLAEKAGSQGDGAKVLELAEDARTVLDGARWLPDVEVRLLASLAELERLAGEVGTARMTLSEAEALYDAQQEKILDLDRATALRALAEIYAALPDPTQALRLYSRAVEAGSENPNARPRAEDLSATCRSLALAGIEPGAELRRRLHELQSQLGPPW